MLDTQYDINFDLHIFLNMQPTWFSCAIYSLFWTLSSSGVVFGKCTRCFWFRIASATVVWETPWTGNQFSASLPQKLWGTLTCSDMNKGQETGTNKLCAQEWLRFWSDNWLKKCSNITFAGNHCKAWKPFWWKVSETSWRGVFCQIESALLPMRYLIQVYYRRESPYGLNVHVFRALESTYTNNN